MAYSWQAIRYTSISFSFLRQMSIRSYVKQWSISGLILHMLEAKMIKQDAKIYDLFEQLIEHPGHYFRLLVRQENNCQKNELISHIKMLNVACYNSSV